MLKRVEMRSYLSMGSGFALLFLALSLIAPRNAEAKDNAAYPLTERDRIIYSNAFAAIDTNDWGGARRIAASGKDPLPAKIIQWLDLIQPGSSHSFSEIADFLAKNPDWPRRETLFRQAEAALSEDMPPEKIIRWFEGREPLSAAGALSLLNALLIAKQSTAAAHLAEKAWINLNFNRPQENEFKKRFGHLIHQSADIARMDRLLWEGQSDQATWMLSRVDAGHQALARARMKLAASAPDVESAVASVPKSLQRDAGLIFERARWNRRHGNDERAASLLDPPPSALSEPDIFWDELQRAIRYCLDKKDYKRAYRLAAGHHATSGEAFADGEFLAGWVALRYLHNSKTAFSHFRRLYEGSRSPITRARGAYWAGRAFDGRKDKNDAAHWYEIAARYPLTFYGQLAASQIPGRKPVPLPPAPVPTEKDRQDFNKSELRNVVLILHAFGEDDRVKPFLLQMVEMAGNTAEQSLIADLALAIDRKDYSIQAAKAARPLGIELTQHLYPMGNIAKNDKPEPALILGVIRQESAFDPTIVSPAGARGLMQLMPKTAKAIAQKAGMTYSENALTSDGGYNIAIGRAYLRQILDNFDGSYVLAAAAYNAGPARAVEWIRRNGDPRQTKTDIVDWIENIPFEETRNYVQRIIEGVHIYRARLNGNMLIPVSEKDIGRALRY